MADEPPVADKPVKGGENAKVHAEALKRLNETWSVEAQNVANGREDQRFYAGDQWDEASRRARGTTRPMLTINRLPAFVRQLTGDVRQNPPAIKVLPAKGEASQETADILNGVIRDIEAESDATACYVIAVDNAAQTGQGAFRIVTEYDDDPESFDQEIRIRPIRDPFGFLIDPNAVLPDKSDMKFGWVFERMSNDAFRAKYPDKALDDIPISNAAVAGTIAFTWRTGDTVRIAEYWRKVETKRTVKAVDGRSRELTETKVEMYLMSGADILSGPHPWAGKHIPICVVSGEESVVDGSVNRRGIIRDAKDAQRFYNYSRTAAAEAIALQPKMPWLLTPDMIKGYEDMWDSAGTENLPYLLHNPDRVVTTGPRRAEPALAQNGLDAQALIAAQDIEATTGIFKANLGAEGQEKSGKAILARQKEGDTGTFLYVDNLRRAIGYCGRCLADLIPKIYDGERIVRMLKEDGDHEMVPINQPVPVQGLPGEFETANDLTVGKYSVQVSTGPSYLTRRQEQADKLIMLAEKMPQVGQVAPDLLVKSLDFPGGDELAARLKKTVPPALLEPDPPEGAPPKPPPPPPPDVIAAAEKDAAAARKANAEADKTQVETAALLQQLLTTMQAVQQQLSGGGQPPMGGPPMQPPGPPPMPPPDAMPPPPDAMPPPPPGLDGIPLEELQPIDLPPGAP